MRVSFTAQARADLLEIGDFIAMNDPHRAGTFVRGLMAAASGLSEAPEIAPLLQRYRHLGIRKRLWRGYLILYRITNDTIVVIRVVHGARDYEMLLFPGGQTL